MLERFRGRRERGTGRKTAGRGAGEGVEHSMSDPSRRSDATNELVSARDGSSGHGVMWKHSARSRRRPTPGSSSRPPATRPQSSAVRRTVLDWGLSEPKARRLGVSRGERGEGAFRKPPSGTFAAPQRKGSETSLISRFRMDEVIRRDLAKSAYKHSSKRTSDLPVDRDVLDVMPHWILHGRVATHEVQYFMWFSICFRGLRAKVPLGRHGPKAARSA
jgi:hypothetical protein